MSLNHLSEKYGYSVMGIRNALVRSGVKMRAKGDPMQRITSTLKDVDVMVAMANTGATCKAIALKVGRNPSTVRRWLEKRGVSLRKRAGEDCVHWKGGRYITAEGYVRVRNIKDEMAVLMSGSCGSVLEHRLVMAKHIGRPLEQWETVHHINGDKQDNRIENLQLRIGNHGKHIVYRCSCCGSYDITPSEMES